MSEIICLFMYVLVQDPLTGPDRSCDNALSILLPDGCFVLLVILHVHMTKGFFHLFSMWLEFFCCLNTCSSLYRPLGVLRDTFSPQSIWTTFQSPVFAGFLTFKCNNVRTHQNETKLKSYKKNKILYCSETLLLHLHWNIGFNDWHVWLRCSDLCAAGRSVLTQVPFLRASVKTSPDPKVMVSSSRRMAGKTSLSTSQSKSCCTCSANTAWTVYELKLRSLLIQNIWKQW